MFNSRLSMKASRFHVSTPMLDAQLEATSLGVIIVGANPRLSKEWYEESYSGDKGSSTPSCFSLDGQTPNEKSKLPQNNLCASCPQNAWGSRLTPEGRKIKACSDQKRLALVMADKAGGEVYLLKVTPASLSNLNNYQKTLMTRGIAPEIAVTTVSFDTDVRFPKLKFAFGGFVDASAQHVVDKLIGSDDVKIITGELAYASGQIPTASDFGFGEEVGFIQTKHELGGSNDD